MKIQPQSAIGVIPRWSFAGVSAPLAMPAIRQDSAQEPQLIRVAINLIRW